MHVLVGFLLASYLVNCISCQQPVWPVWSQFPTSHHRSDANSQRTTQTLGQEVNNRKDDNKRISEIKCDEYEKYVVEITQGARGLAVHSKAGPEKRDYRCAAKTQGLIVGGKKAIYGEYPHMALVGYKEELDDPNNANFYCGGSLISENFVLTAAHCKIKATGKITNYARFNTIGRKSENQIDSSGTFISHPSYSLDGKNYDIALLKLSKSFDFEADKRVLPACLHSQSQSINIQTANATGWGYTEYGDLDPSQYLQKVTLDMIDCNAKGRRDLFNTFCASSPGKDTCQGDSGGPLQIEKRDSKGEYTCQMFVIGVTAQGSAACGLKNSYGVYTKVSKFLDWIEQNVWPNKIQTIKSLYYISSHPTTTTEETGWVWGK